MSITRKFDRSAQVLAALTNAAHQGLRETALFIEARAEALVPVDTGRLRGTIEAEETGRLEMEVQEGEGLVPNYGVFQEFGTVRMAPQPHLTPAAQEGERVFGELVAAKMRDVR